jgi:hypothetical protein
MQQSHPMMGPLYRQRRLWEQVPAAGAADDLRDTLAEVLRRQHAAATQRFAKCNNPLRGLLRWLLTIGAIVWFPIVQPVLELALNDSLAHTARGVLLLAVQLLGATYLLRSAGFLAIWFVFPVADPALGNAAARGRGC